jgi:phenylacetate-CoA ligase
VIGKVNAETNFFVEILDEKYCVAHGQEGRIVITLFNKAHPFIRYDIGDIGILDENSTFLRNPFLKD